MSNFWDTGVWGEINLFAVLLLGLLAASILKKAVKILRESLIPTSVLGGGLLLAISSIYKLFAGDGIFATSFLQSLLSPASKRIFLHKREIQMS